MSSSRLDISLNTLRAQASARPDRLPSVLELVTPESSILTLLSVLTPGLGRKGLLYRNWVGPSRTQTVTSARGMDDERLKMIWRRWRSMEQKEGR
jgi:hypothetical protein